jgi:hypothetical protein
MPDISEEKRLRRRRRTMIAVIGAIIIVAVLVIIVARNREGVFSIKGAADGSTVSVNCSPDQTINIIKATYTPDGKSPVDVKDKLQALAAQNNKFSYTVSGSSLGQTPPGTLSFSYKCPAAPAKSGFSSCASGGRADHFATNAIENYRHDKALQQFSDFELQPGQPNYMEDVGEGATNLMAAISRRSPAVAGGSPLSLVASTDIDSDFLTDGFYENAVLKEALTSSRRTSTPNTLTANLVGLGSIRIDPRFDPGPRARVASGDASASHGGHAGGVTLGGFGSNKFQTNGGWDWNYVHGFGDTSRY